MLWNLALNLLEDGLNYDPAGLTCPLARFGLAALVLQQSLRFTQNHHA
jgi:hypothetical protein